MDKMGGWGGNPAEAGQASSIRSGVQRSHGISILGDLHNSTAKSHGEPDLVLKLALL